MTSITIRTGNGFPSGPARYDVRHVTTYAYSEAVPVCHNQIHLVPRQLPGQRLLSSFIAVEPTPPHVSTHSDYFGNTAESFSIAQRHRELLLESVCEVETTPTTPPQEILDITVAEARQIRCCCCTGRPAADHDDIKIKSAHASASRKCSAGPCPAMRAAITAAAMNNTASSMKIV
jgi:hypothetical protein